MFVSVMCQFCLFAQPIMFSKIFHNPILYTILNFFYFFIKGQPNIITLQFYLGSKTIGKHGMWVVRSSYTTHMERSGDSGQGTLE